MRIAIFSDLQGYDFDSWDKLMKIGLPSDISLIVTLGDIDFFTYKLLVERFKNCLFIGVHGNHDGKQDLDNLSNLYKNKVYNNHLTRIKYKNIQFLGLEGCVKYKGEKVPMYTQEEASNMFFNAPDCDILISHNSPKGIHDSSVNISHEGFKTLLDYLNNNKPKYHLHGHQHINKITYHEDTAVISLFGGWILDLENLDTINILKMN